MKRLLGIVVGLALALAGCAHLDAGGRDGFVSLHAEGEGTFVTKPLVFGGEWLFVNADCPKGELRMEVRDENGNHAFSRAHEPSFSSAQRAAICSASFFVLPLPSPIVLPSTDTEKEKVLL